MRGTVYTETVIHSAPAAFVDQAPYQLIIVTLDDGKRITGRVVGQAVAIDDPVVMVENRAGIPFFQKADS